MTKEFSLRQQDIELVDGESNPIMLDVCYEIRDCKLDQTINSIRNVHGAGVKFLPLSGKSAGGGVFQIQAPAGATVVGLNFSAALQPRIRHASGIDITEVSLDEIVISRSDHTVCAGAAITLQQLNQALAVEVGPQYTVLGADLTSYTYAQVGSTFMTGGMGPQRRYFSDSVVEVSLYDGSETSRISGDALLNYAGTYGWTGLVSAVRCSYHQLPGGEFAFSIPVKNAPGEIAGLLNHFSRFVYLQSTSTGGIESISGSESIILGLEHITVDSAQPLLSSGHDNSAVKIAREVVEKCKTVNADGMIFINGLSSLPIDEVIGELVDDAASTRLTIAGIDLDYTHYFPDLNLMRDLREAVSYEARNQAPRGSFSYKGHTDVNIWVDPQSLESSVYAIWQAHEKYIDCVEEYFASQALLSGEILIYGHLNPVGMDPHNRITFATQDKALLHEAINSLDELKRGLVIELADICDTSGSIFTGGEKGAGSDHELLSAFATPKSAPKALHAKYIRQKAAVRSASPCFNWRALAPYR